MKNSIVVAVLLAGAAALPLAAQAPAKAMPAPPAGFTVIPSNAMAAMRAAGVADGIQADKPNDNWSNCIVDPKVRFDYGWTAIAGADKSLELEAQAPEEPADVVNGTRDEPAGKSRYKGGLLIWRKTTQPVVGSSGACRDGVVMYSGTWKAYMSGKLIAISVANLYKSKDAGQGWIDAYIEKLVAVVSAGR